MSTDKQFFQDVAAVQAKIDADTKPFQDLLDANRDLLAVNDKLAFAEKIQDALTYNADGTEKTGRPVRSLGWLRQALTLLGLPTDFLAAAEAEERRASDLSRATFERQSAASQRRAAALQRIVTDAGADLDEVASEWLSASPWLDTPPGAQRPPLAELVYNARRQVEQRVMHQVFAASERIFSLAQRKAAEIVAEVAALPPFPKDIWLAPVPAEVLGRIPEHRSSWGTLDSTRRDFELAVQVGNFVRDHIGAGPDSLPDGAPPQSLTFRRWKAWLADIDFGRVKPELRLRYSLEHDFGPGVWRPQDIRVAAEDQTFGAKLRNLGSAVTGHI